MAKSVVSAHPEISSLTFVEYLDSQTPVLQESGWSQDRVNFPPRSW